MSQEKTTKLNPLLKSIIVLTVICLVASALLTVASHFLKPSRDIDFTVKQAMATLAQSKELAVVDIDLSKQENILNVVKVQGGANKDCYILRGEGIGWSSGAVQMLILVDETQIIRASVLSVATANDQYNPDMRIKYEDFFEGKTSFSSREQEKDALNAHVSATHHLTGRAIIDATMIPFEFFMDNKSDITGASVIELDMEGVEVGDIGPVVVESTDLTPYESRLTALGYSLSNLEGHDYAFEGTGVVGAYTITGGDNAGNLLVVAHATGSYDSVAVMALEFDDSGCVRAEQLYINANFEGIYESQVVDIDAGNYDEYRSALRALNYTAIVAGKTSDQITRNVVFDGVVVTSTLTTTPNVVTTALVNALKFYEANGASLMA